MNEKQVKKYAVISIIACYVLLMLPLIISKMHTWILDRGTMQFVTTEATIGKIILSVLSLSLLFILIYSNNISRWLDKTKVGKWINTPARGYKK